MVTVMPQQLLERMGVNMLELEVGHHYLDNDDTVFRCLAVRIGSSYSEAVLEAVGDVGMPMFAIFYRSNYAWLDRENPDFKLMEEVDYFPSVVMQ